MWFSAAIKFISGLSVNGKIFHCLLLFLPAITICFPAFSQNPEIRARVIDSTTLEPVAFSTIYIDEFTGTITDETGFFRMQVPADKYSDTLHVSCIGYLYKDILINSLSLFSLDSIYLLPHVIELDAVDVQAETRKAPTARDIIKLSIRKIPENYPDKPVLYNGYYREYIKKEEQYINLFESIINLEDPGFQSVDNFNAGLMYKRINQDFRVDSQLMRPYDNRDKFVPYSVMPIPLNNELVILRAHDPVRNYNRESLYFIECLEKDFIRNHDFSSPKLTYLNDRPYYQITFQDNRKYTIGINRISLTGTIYIDALNYGIRRINYRATIDNGATRQKLFELSLEYKLVDETYLLHYLSFNNLFNTRNLTLRRTNIYDDKLQLAFNKPLNAEYAADPENFTVYLQDRKQKIEKIELEQYSMLITFSENSEIYEKLRINLLPRNITTRKKISDNEKALFNDLHVEFTNFKDLRGNDYASTELNEYYQYREFFTNLIYTGHNGITSNLVNKSKPVIENQIFGEYSGDTSWMNTPLIEERVTGRKIYSNNAELNNLIETLSLNDENRLNEIIYIHTDREVYAPEDTVWFKAYIRNKKYLTESRLSKTFDILLVSSTGEIISREKYLTTESGTHGQLPLSHTLEEGIYYIAGFSSWMKNFDTGNLFSKKIMVLKDKQDALQLRVAFDKPEYSPGDTILMQVNCYDDFNREVDDVSFSYSFVCGKEVLQKGRGNTSFSWLEPVKVIIPPGMDTIPSIEFRSSYKSQRLDTIYPLPVNHDIHLDFFPEGGYCINGIETKIAFKAVTNNGNPVEIAGEITDHEGKVIGTAVSRHDGMGVFLFRPQQDRSSYFHVTRPAGQDKKFLLPEGRNEGWQMHVKTEDKNNHEIELDITNVNTENDIALITLMMRGYLCYYDVIKTGRKRSVKIPADDLPHGIAVLTLFDTRLQPQAERLVYIHPGCNYQANLLTDRLRYIPRDSVLLSVSLLCENPALPRGTYSLSVIDDQLCSSPSLDEPGIKSSLLLSPEIHGKIHRPDDYFDEKNDSAPEDLDLLLMTQGWRNYKYLGVTGDSVNTVRPENKDIISGRLMKQPPGTESKATDGSLNVYYSGNSTVIPVNKDGKFSFIPEYSEGFNTGIFLYAEDKNGRSNLSIILDSSFFENQLQSYLKYLADSMDRVPASPVTGQYRLQDFFSLALENHQWLEEVIIRKTVNKKELSIADLAFSKRKADQDEIDMAVYMEDLESMVRKSNRDSVPVYYCIDGILQFTYVSPDKGFAVMVPDYSYAYHILPEQIEEYTVIRGPEVQALYGYGIEYVIDVKTKPFSDRESNRKWQNPLRIGKFAVVKEFYKPLYDTEEKRKSTIPDLRKTIHWEPELQFQDNGKAEIKFYNGDRYTRIRCILEGITEEGVPVHVEHYYNVTLTREE